MNAKYYPLIKLSRQAAVMKRRFTLPFKLLSSGFIRSESYYPEMPHKSRFRIAMELLGHIMRYGSIEWHYFSYGFDIKGLRDKNEYLDDNWFLWKSSMLNTVLPERDISCILRDKRLFSDFLSIWGFESPKIIGELHGQHPNSEVLNRMTTTNGQYFVKPLDGQCGKGIFEVLVSDDVCIVNNKEVTRIEVGRMVLEDAQEGTYLVQEKVIQHPKLNEIYANSINTVRLVTIYDKKNDAIIPLSAILRIGVNGNVVDNWAVGGLVIGVNVENGTLKEYGFYKHGYGTKVLSHPNTGMRFEGFEIPYWKEAVKKALALHRCLLPIMIIGWDIAITPQGPLFIEGNDNMEISLNQTGNKGLRKELLSIIG